MSFNITKNQFESLLDKTKDFIISNPMLTKDISNGDQFEELVFGIINKFGLQEGFSFIHTGKLTFPDIYISHFGIEVKYSNSGKWTSTGNSITETTRVREVSYIYIFYGKRDSNKIEISWKMYEECLSDIVVTHHPRYLIDMELNAGDTIFEKMGIPYECFSGPDAIKKLQKYYRRTLKPGEEIWWLDESDVIKSPVIYNSKKINRNQVQVEGMVICPEIFSNSGTKYFNLAVYLLKNYNVLSTNLRDIFSAGGLVSMTAKDCTITPPRIFHHLFKRAEDINQYLITVKRSFLMEHWNIKYNDIVSANSKASKEELWKIILNTQAVNIPALYKNGLTASDIYEEGLVRK